MAGIYFHAASSVILPGGGIITIDGNYRIHTFLEDGFFTVTDDSIVEVEYLVVGGGGNGGMGYNGGPDPYGAGGGGAGGLRYKDSYVISIGNKTVIIGGAEENSQLDTIIASAGGRGGDFLETGDQGGSGGGGGSHYLSIKPLGGTGNIGGFDPVEGYGGGKGNNGSVASNYRVGGGGGGAGGAGADGILTNFGIGGIGLSYSISGEAVTYASGGDGSNPILGNGSDGAANTGNGGVGGGGDFGNNNGGIGGSGIVIIRYRY